MKIFLLGLKNNLFSSLHSHIPLTAILNSNRSYKQSTMEAISQNIWPSWYYAHYTAISPYHDTEFHYEVTDSHSKFSPLEAVLE